MVVVEVVDGGRGGSSGESWLSGLQCWEAVME